MHVRLNSGAVSMGRILAPVIPSTYNNGHLDWYGAVEVDVESGEEVWRFDATDSRFGTAELTQTGQSVMHSGFRPASVQRLDDGRTLIAGWRRGVIVEEDGDLLRSFTHELMNDAHEVQRTESGMYLVAATGMDSVVLLDEDFRERWRWHMWEHVDPGTRPGQYYPHKLWYRDDAKNFALNPDDRYHLNYATFIEGDGSSHDETMLCSALNYGVFTVDVETGDVTNEFTDLDECHNPYLLEDGSLVVPESGADRVVRVDWDERGETLFEGGLDFVKDADPIDDDRWLVTDTRNHRVLVWDETESEPEAEFFLGQDTNPYEADYLPGTR